MTGRERYHVAGENESSSAPESGERAGGNAVRVYQDCKFWRPRTGPVPLDASVLGCNGMRAQCMCVEQPYFQVEKVLFILSLSG